MKVPTVSAFSPRDLWIVIAVCAFCADVRAQPDPPPDSPGSTRAASPWPPPTASDIVFVVSEGPGLDVLVGHGPLHITLETTRYLGPTNSDGTLKNAQALVQRGLLSDYAILDIPSFDVDYATNPPNPPQRDTVFFNGEAVASFRLPNHPYLRGAHEKWELHRNRFLIPIEKVRFPSQPGADNEAPVAGENEISIDVDIHDVGWVVQIDWISLTLKATSPVLLVHGNSSNGGFFARQKFTEGLTQRKLLWNNSISFAPNQTTIEANGRELARLVPPLAKQFGVDSVHIVAHSKGGLDARQMLGAHYQGQMESTVKVLSLTTLSTPHEGSVLADAITGVQSPLYTDAYASFWEGFTDAQASALKLAKFNDGYPPLTTALCEEFNRTNLPRLPQRTKFNAVAADADRNGSATIDEGVPFVVGS